MLFNIVAPRGDAAKSIVKAVFSEIDEILAAFPLGVDGLRRCDDNSVTLAVEERREFFVTAGGDSFLVQARDALRGHLLNNEYHQCVNEPAISNETDFLSCQLFAAIQTGSAHNELLIDSAGQKDQIRFTFNVSSEERWRGEITELDFP